MRIISGKYGRRRFDVPTNISARPTTDFARENLFNVLSNFTDFDGITAIDLFAGTGAVSFELLSRGCAAVTSVELAQTQLSFIRKVSGILRCENHRIIKADAFRFIENASSPVDFIFADPPYSHPRFAEIPSLILNSPLVKAGTIVVVEHSSAHDFSSLKGFADHRVYGSVNFSIFITE